MLDSILEQLMERDGQLGAQFRSTAPSLGDIARALEPWLPHGYEAVLFGSRATGRRSSSSDWDIGVLGPAPLEGAVMERLREALEELPTLHRFDVVDLATVPDAFRAAALETAVKIR